MVDRVCDLTLLVELPKFLHLHSVTELILFLGVMHLLCIKKVLKIVENSVFCVLVWKRASHHLR